jgi:hypothetical protein
MAKALLCRVLPTANLVQYLVVRRLKKYLHSQSYGHLFSRSMTTRD